MGITTRPLEVVHKPVGDGTTGRRVGYLVAAVLDGVLLYVVNNVLDWGWTSFLTDDFTKVLTIINVLLIASLVVNLAWIVADPVLFKSSSQIGLNAISFVVTIRLWQVFPFDLSSSDFPWEMLLRTVLMVGLFGLVLGSIAELVKMARYAVFVER